MVDEDHADCFRLLSSGRLERASLDNPDLLDGEWAKLNERLGFERAPTLELGVKSYENFRATVHPRYNEPVDSHLRWTSTYGYLVIITFWSRPRYVFVEDLPDLLPFLAQLGAISSAAVQTTKEELEQWAERNVADNE